MICSLICCLSYLGYFLVIMIILYFMENKDSNQMKLDNIENLLCEILKTVRANNDLVNEKFLSVFKKLARIDMLVATDRG